MDREEMISQRNALVEIVQLSEKRLRHFDAIVQRAREEHKSLLSRYKRLCYEIALDDERYQKVTAVKITKVDTDDLTAEQIIALAKHFGIDVELKPNKSVNSKRWAAGKGPTT